MKNTFDQLEKLKPCKEGLAFARSHESLAVAWEKCERADWMIWLLHQMEKMPQKVSVRFARFCADSVKQHAADAAARTARDVERKNQTNFLRTLVLNPFI